MGRAEKTTVVTDEAPHKLHKSNAKKLLIGLIVAGALLIAGVLSYAHFHHKKAIVKNVCSSPMAGDLLQQASNNVFGASQGRLYVLVQKVKGLPDYQYDQNCLYILTDYYTFAHDWPTAQKYMTALKTTYDPINNPLSSKLGTNFPDPNLLQSFITSRRTE